MGLELVECERKYWDFILELRNSLREGFIQQGTIKLIDHYRYMETYSCDYYVALEDGTPVGWVGEINKDIRVATHPDHQKKGVAKFMINELMKLKPNSYAKVKLDNNASVKLFESCGFKKKYFLMEREDA